jgi:hypothetical protein
VAEGTNRTYPFRPMSGVVVLGLLWAAVGILLGLRWWTERDQPLGHHVAREAQERARGRARFGQLAESRADHRRQAMLGAYAVGTSLVSAGFLLRAALPLALGAALVNLGTLYRYLVLLLDEAPATEPVLARPAHRRGRQPLVTRVLVGDAK